MSYAPKRPSISKSRRARIFLSHNGICWLCKEKIGAEEPYDIDHMHSRELGGSDEDDNLAPAHKECHKTKTKLDVSMIAKSNRIRKKLAKPVPERKPKEQRAKIPSAKREWPKRKIGKWKNTES